MALGESHGKVILFGEHSVVYNQKAIGMSIPQNIIIDSSQSKDKKLHILSDHFKQKKLLFATLDYLQNKFCIKTNILTLVIQNNIPRSSGLGSSSALVSATIKSILRLHNIEFSTQEVIEMSYEIEKQVFGKVSGIDNFLVNNNGLYYFSSNNKEKIELSNKFCFVLLRANKKSKSTGELVSKVNELRKRQFNIVDSIIETLGKIVDQSRYLIEKEDLEEVGSLMNVAHFLLASLGVSSKKLNNIQAKSVRLGSYGAKLTGAGSGGFILSLIDPLKFNLFQNKFDILKIN